MNNEELTCRTSEHGPEVTASPRPEYDDFTRSLRERAVAGERLSAALPPPLQSAAAAGRLPRRSCPRACRRRFYARSVSNRLGSDRDVRLGSIIRMILSSAQLVAADLLLLYSASTAQRKFHRERPEVGSVRTRL